MSTSSMLLSLEHSIFSHGPSSREHLIILVLFITTLSIIPVGYHIIVLNVPASTIQQAIVRNTEAGGGTVPPQTLSFLWSFVVSCQSIGAFCGCFLINRLADFYGTKKSLLVINNIFLLAGSFFMFLSFYVETLLLLAIGRLLIGIYTGLACALVPIFIQEIMPTHLKGPLSCFVHIAVCVGSAFGAFLSIEWMLGTSAMWHVLLAIPSICAIFELAVSRYIPETPNYYLAKGDKFSAADSIVFYYSDTFAEYHGEMAIEKYKQLVTKVPNQISVNEAWTDPEIRKGVILGMIVSAAQIFSGSMAAVSYSTSMFNDVSFISFLIPFVPSLGAMFSVFLTLPAVKLVETCSRKELLINTMVVCVIANYLMTVFSLISEAFGGGSWASIAFAMTFLLLGTGYNLGTGPVAYFMPGELVPPKASGIAMSFSVAVNWLCTMVTTIIYYPLIEAVGGWSYLLFALPTTIGVAILHFWLPDNLEHIATPPDGLILTCNVPFSEDDGSYGTFDNNAGNNSSCESAGSAYL